MINQDLSLLLVEDNTVDADLVRSVLHHAAPTWQFSQVGSLHAALEHLARHGVDVVMFDLGLPDSQGVAGVNVLLNRFPQQALLVLSGDDDVATSVKAVQHGAQDYLIKSKIGNATLVRSLLYAVERHRARQARRFNQAVVRLFNESESLDTVLEGFVNEAAVLTGCAAVAVRLLDEDGNLSHAHSQGLPPGLLACEGGLNVHREGCLCVDTVTGRAELARHLCTRRGALAVEDLPSLVNGMSEANRARMRAACLDAGFRTQLLIPIRTGESITGLVQLADPAVRKLPQLWIEVLEDTALQLGVAIARFRAAEALRHSERQLGHLNAVLNAIRKVNGLITRQPETQDLLDGTCRALIESRGWQAAWIVTLDSAGKPQAWAEQGLGPAMDELQRRFGPGQPPHCWTRSADSADVLCIDDTQAACGDCPVAVRFKGSGAMAARLRAGGKDLGLLCVSVPAGFTITDEERALFSELAGDLAFALHSRQVEHEREEMQRRLLLEMRRSHQITELAPVVIVALDLEGRIEWVNRAGCELTGLSASELLGRHACSTFVVERERERLTRDFVAGLAGDFERIRRYECTVRAASGTEFLVAWHNALRFAADGKVEGLLCAGEDITERRRAQAQLSQSDRMATVGMLAAGVAHEINNPLTYILYNLEEVALRVPRLIQAVTALRQRLVADFGAGRVGEVLGDLGDALSREALADLSSSIEDATTGASRVRDIVRDLKVFSRVDDDTRGLVDVRIPVETAISMTFNEIKYRARLVRDLPSLPPVIANDGRLSQVFVNLLINAAQAIREGDVQNQQIAVRGRVAEGVVEVEIADTGKGIAAEVLPLIFEPFFTTKPAGVGSGLGLSISRNIVASFGGEILVESEPDRGTRFRVRLPVASSSAEQPFLGAQAPVVPMSNERLKVLAVDDDPLMRSLIQRLLGTQHEVATVESGAAAIQLLNSDRSFDVLLCDVMMPEITGVDVFEHVQTHAPELISRFIFMTGGIFTPSTREYLQRHPRPTLEKPFDPDALRQAVRDVSQQPR